MYDVKSKNENGDTVVISEEKKVAKGVVKSVIEKNITT